MFYINNEFKTVAPSGPRFERLMMDAPKSFVGVYDRNCTIEMIYEDLEYMVMKCANYANAEVASTNSVTLAAASGF